MFPGIVVIVLEVTNIDVVDKDYHITADYYLMDNKLNMTRNRSNLFLVFLRMISDLRYIRLSIDIIFRQFE